MCNFLNLSRWWGLDVPAIEAVQCVRPTQSLKYFVAANRTSIAALPRKRTRYLDWPHWELETSRIARWRPSMESGPVYKDNALQSAVSWMHSYLQASAPRVEALPTSLTLPLVQTYLPICPSPKLDGVWDRYWPVRLEFLDLEDATEIEEVSLEPIPAHQTVVDVLIEVQQRTGRRPGWIFYQLKELEDIESFTLGIMVCYKWGTRPIGQWRHGRT